MAVAPQLKVRPRNAAATREAILVAARRRFADEGYDQAGIRQIAGDAGVDAALVSRYFGSKEDLFAEVMVCCTDAGELLNEPRDGFGLRFARKLVEGDAEEDAEHLEAFMVIIRSASSPKAQEIVRRVTAERWLEPFGAWLGAPDGEIRARLFGSLLMGFCTMGAVMGRDRLNPAEREALVQRLGRMLQSLIDG